MTSGDQADGYFLGIKRRRYQAEKSLHVFDEELLGRAGLLALRDQVLSTFYFHPSSFALPPSAPKSTISDSYPLLRMRGDSQEYARMPHIVIGDASDDVKRLRFNA